MPKPSLGSAWDMTHMARPQKMAATRVPRNLSASCLEGVAPIQWPILRSEARAPDAARAVQTTPPTIMVTNMPSPPVSPILSSTTPVMIRVSMVMPDTGLVPTMAMARAATGANRKAMMVTRMVQTRAYLNDDAAPMPKLKKVSAETMKMAMPATATVPDSERSTRRVAVTCPSRLAASALMLAKIDLTIDGSDPMMPRIPAPAMPPTPTIRT